MTNLCTSCGRTDGTNYQPKVRGRRFTCPCGCNVFHATHDPKLGCLLACNACGAEYEAK